MADISVSIISFLQSQTKPVNSLTIAKNVGLTTTREINPMLYKLLSDKKVIKIFIENSLQPFWKYNQEGDAISNNILEELRKSKDFVLTKDLKNFFPNMTKTELNSVLYSLQKRGLIVKKSNPDGTNPSWAIK